MLVQSLIDRGGVQLNVRVGFLQRGNPFRRRHQHQHLDAGAAGVFQQIDSGDHRPTGGQHRVNDQRHTFIDVRHQFLEVRHRLEGFFIAIDTDHADTRAWHVLQHPFHHAEASAQDRHNGNFLALDLLDFHRTVPAFNSDFLSLQIGGGFISQ